MAENSDANNPPSSSSSSSIQSDGGAESAPPSDRRLLQERQTDALEQLAYVLAPKKGKRGNLAKILGACMLAFSIVLGGYEFAMWMIDQWQTRAMLANWVAVAREMQEVENSPELALELLEKADELVPQSGSVVRLRAYVRGMQAVKQLLALDRPFQAADVALAASAAAEASLLEQIDGGSPDWAFLRGQLAMAQNEPDRARAYLLRALEIEPEHVMARVRLAELRNRAGLRALHSGDESAAKAAFAEAKQFLNDALAIDPRSKWAMLYMATSLIENEQDFDGALEWIDRAVAVDPRFDLAFRNRGAVYFYQERWTEAETALQRALEIDPSSSGSLNLLAQVYGYADEYESARIIAKRSVSVNPSTLVGWAFLGDVTRDMALLTDRAGRAEESTELLKESIAAYSQAVDLDPRSADVRIGRSTAYIQAGDLENAGLDARKAVALVPKDPYALQVLADYQAKIGQHAEVLKTVEQILALEPAFDTAWQLKGESHLALGQSDLAGAAFDAAVEHASDDLKAEMLSSRAKFRVGLGNTALALEDYTQARTAQPEDFDAWIGEVATLIALQRNDEACVALIQAAQIKPSDERVKTLAAQAGCAQ